MFFVADVGEVRNYACMKPLPLVLRPWFTALAFGALMFVFGLAFFELADAALTAILGAGTWFVSMTRKNQFASFAKDEDR